MTETLGDWEQPGRKSALQADPVARRDALRRDLDRVYAEVAQLEAELEGEGGEFAGWVDPRHRSFILAGLAVGFVGASASLLFHIIGSLAVDGNPLQVVRVYLTILLGERALIYDSGRWLAAGTCAYLAAGSVYGVLFHLVLARWFAQAPGIWRLLVSSSLGIVIWILNFYFILSWLQPLVTGGPSITALVPFWLAAMTHLVFAWTIFLMEEWGRTEMPARA